MTFGSDAFGALLVLICFALVSFLEVSFKTLTKDLSLQEVGSPSKSCNNAHTHAGTIQQQCDDDSDGCGGDDVDSDDSVDSDDDCTLVNPCGDGQKCNLNDGVAVMCFNEHNHRRRLYLLKYGNDADDDSDGSEDDDNSDGSEGEDDDSEHNGQI